MNQQQINEALLLFAHTKIEMAERLRQGINYSDFLSFEEKLDQIDKILMRTEKQLKRKIDH